jgi:tetratricopeptide (TPR) repeat protein
MIPRRLLLCATLAAGLGGCALLPSFKHRLELRPVTSELHLPSRREDGYYASAKTAIVRRDYALALDLLQAARAVNPDDPRVLNAFGVVYDKLSRFDLSARYYAEASARDPGSMIVASNMAWSAALQARAAAPALGDVQPARLALSAAEPAEQRQAMASERPAVVRLGFAAPAPVTERIGGVVVENAAGRAGTADAVAQGLKRLGWTSRIEPPAGPSPAASTITYPSAKAGIARALAKTLAVRVQLVDCGAECDRIRLTLGTDAATWSIATNDLKEPRK